MDRRVVAVSLIFLLIGSGAGFLISDFVGISVFNGRESNLEENISILEREIGALENKNENLMGQISDLGSRNNTLRDQIGELRSTNQNLTEEITGLNSRIGRLENRITELRMIQRAIDVTRRKIHIVAVSEEDEVSEDEVEVTQEEGAEEAETARETDDDTTR